MNPEPRPLILSASSISEWLRCHYAYLLGSVWRVPAPPNLDMAIGTAVHAGVEALHKGGPDPVGSLQDALIDAMESMPAVPEAEATQGLLDALAMFRLYQDKIAPGFHPTLIEQSFVIDINGVTVSGQIDAADEDVHDTKTTATLSRFRPEKHRFQLSLYRHGYRAITGRWPGRLILDVLARNGRWKQVELQPDDHEVASVLALTSRGILSGDFSPTGALSNRCPRCPFLEVCQYAVVDPTP